MKRILMASAVAFAAGGQALAADLPPPMAPPPRAPATYVPVAPLYNWSGFYIGGNLGAGWNSTGSITDTAGSTFGTTTNTSFLGGGQVGVNYEFWGGVVVGAEAMFDWLPNTKNTINATNAGGATNAAANINNRWLTTATGKLGYAWDRVLLYGKGGGAWVGVSNPSLTVNNGANEQPPSLPTAATTLAGPPVSALNGLSRATGPPEPSGTTSGCRTKAIRLPPRRLLLCERRNQRQQPQHQYVHRRLELQVRRRLVVTARSTSSQDLDRLQPRVPPGVFLPQRFDWNCFRA